MMDKYLCPRCGEHIPNNETPGEYPGAISRWDNATEVCSQCGEDEAMIQMMAHMAQADIRAAVHPSRRPWVDPEPALNGEIA